MGDINDAFDSPLGLTWALIKRHKQKKQLKRIQAENVQSQGITYYQPSQIEDLFDNNEAIGNIILSGGDEFIRLRALAKGIECAYGQGYIPVVLHEGNYNLENYLVNCFGTSNVTFLNGQFPFYDPFIGLNDNEICHIIMNSKNDQYDIKGTGKYYIDGISSFIRSKNIQPYIWMYITCPHLMLIDKVNEAETKGLITESVSRSILTQIVQGELERGNIENFFSELKNEAEFILAKKNNLYNAVSIAEIAKKRGAVVIDLRSNANKLLLNIIMSEIEMLKNKGERVYLCLDGIKPEGNKLVEDYLKTSGMQSVVCMSGTDVYADFSGEDNLFYSVLGRMSKMMLSRHISAYSCQKYSDIVGSYDKKEISDTYTDNMNIVGRFSYGTTNAKNVTLKRENIIKPEEISRLKNDEFYIYDNNSGELAFTQII